MRMPIPSLSVHPSPELATRAAADLLGGWLVQPGVRNVMLAAGNTPLGLYRQIADRKLPLAHLNLFALDEYVGVPVQEPRNCANLIRRTAVEPWGVPGDQYFTVSSSEPQALQSVLEHERRIEHEKRSADRKSQVGSGDRSQRIRTYNFPQNRVTDHRINESFTLDQVMAGRLGLIIEAIEQFNRQQRKSEMERSAKPAAGAAG